MPACDGRSSCSVRPISTGATHVYVSAYCVCYVCCNHRLITPKAAFASVQFSRKGLTATSAGSQTCLKLEAFQAGLLRAGLRVMASSQEETTADKTVSIDGVSFQTEDLATTQILSSSCRTFAISSSTFQNQTIHSNSAGPCRQHAGRWRPNSSKCCSSGSHYHSPHQSLQNQGWQRQARPACTASGWPAAGGRLVSGQPSWGHHRLTRNQLDSPPS